MNITRMTSATTAEWCDLGVQERPRYFPRQLITPVEMNLEQAYFRDKLRRHNRLLHGWGVVCGAMVCAVPRRDGNGSEPWLIRVTPGYILGPYGDEIVIARERTFDLRAGGATGSADDMSADMLDPWCAPAPQRSLPDRVFIAVRYKEILTRQVRVQPAACGCDDAPCEYSRACDGYEFGVRTTCPHEGEEPTDPQQTWESMFGSIAGCPACDDPWVGLAEVTLGTDGQILSIDNCSCRRMVVTFAGVWNRCEAGTIQATGIDPATVARGQEAELTISGTGLSNAVTVSMGPGIDVSGVDYDPAGKFIKLRVKVTDEAALGVRGVTLAAEGCGLRSLPLEVTGRAETPPGGPPPAEERRPRRRGRS